MQTQDKPITEQRPVRARPEPPKMTRRWLVPALAGAAVVILAIVVAFVAFGGGDEPDVITPDFDSDPTLVGEALTVAYNSGDVDAYLGLFAEDAELRFNGGPSSLEDIRSGYQGWDRIMNRSSEWSECAPFGSSATAVMCRVAITDPIWINPLLGEPWPGRVVITTTDGEITQYDYSDRDTANRLALSAFKQWTFENYPGQSGAAVMWDPNTPLPLPRFTEESARLHIELGAEYVAQLDTAP